MSFPSIGKSLHAEEDETMIKSKDIQKRIESGKLDVIIALQFFGTPTVCEIVYNGVSGDEYIGNPQWNSKRLRELRRAQKN